MSGGLLVEVCIPYISQSLCGDMESCEILGTLSNRGDRTNTS